MSSIAKNLGLSVATFASRIISGSVVYIVLARVMSLEDFGLLSFGATLAGLITVMAEFGFSLMAQRDIPQNRFNFAPYVFNTFIQKIGFSLLAFVGGLVYLYFFYSGLNVTIGVIFVVNAIITSGNMYFFAVFRAKNMFKIESWLALFYSVVLLVIIALYFVLDLDLLFIVYGLLLARVFQLLILTVVFITKFKLSFVIDKTIQKYLFKNSFSFGSHYIIGIFYFSVDNQMIAYYSGNEQLAIYQAFFKIVLILLMVNSLLEGVFLPYLSSMYKNGVEEFNKIAKIINKVIISLGLTMFVFFVLFASDIIKILYTDKYLPALVITIPLALVLLMRIMSTVYSVVLTISDNQNLRVITVFLSLVVNVILNFIFIPTFGFIGAAYVSMVTHIVLVGLYIFFGYRQLLSLLIEKKVLYFILLTISIILCLFYFNVTFTFTQSIGILVVWFTLLLLLYSKKQIIDIKQLFLGGTF
jgi:O-antigen/teichoic acid export membrane protein